MSKEKIGRIFSFSFYIEPVFVFKFLIPPFFFSRMMTLKDEHAGLATSGPRGILLFVIL
jgi:hypothetical protein